MKEPKIKNNRFTFLWILPILALGLGLYLGYQKFSSIGPSITIVFSNANGIEAGKTTIRYKDLDIGKVTNIVLSKDMQSVVVSAQMNKSAADLLKADTQFWVVSPQITAAGVSGLGTILSGSYIGISPGKGIGKQNFFVGLDTPPLTPSSQFGIRIDLTTNNTTGLNVGSPVYYRGFKVGQIEQIKFDEKFDSINVVAFINAPYDQLINNNTKFFNASGFNFNLSSKGLIFNMESLATFALGGISFVTPPYIANSDSPIDINKPFILYPSLEAINQPTDLLREYFIVYFNDSSGLTAGSNIMLSGFKIGEVVELKLMYDPDTKKIVVPVLVYIEPGHIEDADPSNESDLSGSDILKSLVENGLQASLETSNFITGEKIINLKIYADEKGKIEKDPYSPYNIFPSHDDTFSELANGLTDVLAKIQQIPFEQIGTNLNQSLIQANNTMKELGKTTQQLNDVMKNLDPNSSLYYMLNQTLENLQKTVKSVGDFSEKLNKKPNAIIFGE